MAPVRPGADGRAGRPSVGAAVTSAMTSSAPIAVLADPEAYARAVDTAAAAAAAYHAGDRMRLDDATYDALVRGIRAYEARHPAAVAANSPTSRGDACGSRTRSIGPILPHPAAEHRRASLRTVAR